MKQQMRDDKNIEKWAYQLLVERLNKFLEKSNTDAILNNKDPQYGIMIVDSENPVCDNKLRKNICEFLRYGTYYGKFRYLIEDPLFTDSKWRNLSQLTDCVAYAIRKHFRNPANPSFHDRNWELYYKMLLYKADTNEVGRTSGCGIKVFP